VKKKIFGGARRKCRWCIVSPSLSRRGCLRDAALGRKPGHIYGRNTNPTVAAFENKVRLMESAEAATSFSSGMAAISNSLFTLLSPGDRVVSVKDTYGGTNKLFLDFCHAFRSK